MQLALVEHRPVSSAAGPWDRQAGSSGFAWQYDMVPPESWSMAAAAPKRSKIVAR